MKIVAIADSHGSNFVDQIPACDLLLMAGDISPVRGSHSYGVQKIWFEIDFIKQLQKLQWKAKHIVFIAGNHDTFFSECNISDNNQAIKSLLPANVHYLCDEMVNIEGVRIWGSPWCNRPEWGQKGPPVWNFALQENELKSIYANIPNDIDILLTHGPAFRFCDAILDPKRVGYDNGNKSYQRESLGSRALAERIKQGIKAKYVISGHIHSAQREPEVYKESLEADAIKFMCVSILDEDYQFNAANNPLVFNY